LSLDSSKKIKLPPTAYVIFCREHRSQIKSNNPSAGIAEQGKILGLMWASLDPVIKKVFKF
jgi:hypothetical protein